MPENNTANNSTNEAIPDRNLRYEYGCRQSYFCIACKRKVTSGENNWSQHVSGKAHKANKRILVAQSVLTNSFKTHVNHPMQTYPPPPNPSNRLHENHSMQQSQFLINTNQPGRPTPYYIQNQQLSQQQGTTPPPLTNHPNSTNRNNFFSHNTDDNTTWQIPQNSLTLVAESYNDRNTARIGQDILHFVNQLDEDVSNTSNFTQPLTY